MNKLDTIEIVVEDINSPTIVDAISSPEIITSYDDYNHRNVISDRTMKIISFAIIVLMIIYYNFAFYLIDYYPKKYRNLYQMIKLLILIPSAIIGNIVCIRSCIYACIIKSSNPSEV